MKKILNYIISIFLIIATFCLTACGEKKSYNTVRKYIDDNAVILDHFCILDDSNYGLICSYEPNDGSISLASNITGADLYIEITISENETTFKWKGKTDGYTMQGTAKKKSITTDTRNLSYDSTTASSVLAPTLNTNCAMGVVLLLYIIQDNFETINISVADLGFKKFN